MRGGGKGALVSNEVSLTLAAGSNDQTLFTADRPWDNSGVNPTLTQCGSGSGTIGASNQELFAQNYNGLVMSIGNGQSAEASIMMKECCQTLNCMHDPQAVLCINEQVSNDGINCAFCFQQNTRNEVRYINGDGAIAGALSAESGMKQTNYICYENHANDSRITESNEVSPLISSRSGTGGGNLPLVQECYVKTAKPTFKGGCETYADTGVAPTVNTFDQGDKRANELVVTSEVFAIDSLSSNSIKSSNPHSGFHKEEIAKTLDTTDPNPTKNQGGNVIVESIAIAENIIGRKVENGGNGIGAQEELAYTQNTSGVMGVANHSTVRRLLPVECERMMGFPDNWTRIPWKGKPAEGCPDSPRYKACGNSMCVNCMEWIGRRISEVEKKK